MVLFLEMEVPLEILTSLWAFLFIGTLGTRLGAKWIIEFSSGYRSRSRDRVAIFGAGKAGVALVNALESNLSLHIICFFVRLKKT